MDFGLPARLSIVGLSLVDSNKVDSRTDVG